MFLEKIGRCKTASITTEWSCSPRRVRPMADKIDNGFVSYSHFAAENRWDLVCRNPADGFVHSVCRATSQRADSGSAWPESGRSGGVVSADRGHVQTALERGFYAARSEHVLLLAGAVPGGDASHYHHRSHPIWQHAPGGTDGDRRCERRHPVRVRDRVVRRLRN